MSPLALFAQGIDNEHADSLIALAEDLEDRPVLAQALRLIDKLSKLTAAPLVAHKLDSARPEIRAAAIERLGELRAAEGREPLARLVAAQDSQVRRAAAAVGKLRGQPRKSYGRRRPRGWPTLPIACFDAKESAKTAKRCSVDLVSRSDY